MVCNIVANPNIRYLIVGGPESEGHLTGEALKALILKGVDDRKHILGTNAPHPFLFNLPTKAIEQFRKQVSLIDLQFEGDPNIVRKAVWSCYQESPVQFRGHSLYDPGAYPEPPLSGKITWRVSQPWVEPPDEQERDAMRRGRALIERLRARARDRRR
jgi:tetrahydromethanopterin S-methyltransferase subunit A